MGKFEIIGGYNRQLNDKEYCIIRDMMLKEEGIREIFGNCNRLIDYVMAGLIKYDDEYIGFFALAKERIDNIFFVDRGIKEEYRGMGLGTFCVKYIVDNFPRNEFLISETTTNNIAAITSVLKVGELIYQKDNLNYYLLNKSKRLFINSGMYDKFVEYENKPKLKSYEMMRKMMNER